MKTIEENISTFGLLTKLTNSQTDNFEIIKNHWIKFNAELKKYNLIQNDENWEVQLCPKLLPVPLSVISCS